MLPRGAIFEWDGVIIAFAEHHELGPRRFARELLGNSEKGLIGSIS